MERIVRSILLNNFSLIDIQPSPKVSGARVYQGVIVSEEEQEGKK